MSEEQEPTTATFKPTEFNMGPQDMPRLTCAIQCAMGGLATAVGIAASTDDVGARIGTIRALRGFLGGLLDDDDGWTEMVKKGMTMRAAIVHATEGAPEPEAPSPEGNGGSN